MNESGFNAVKRLVGTLSLTKAAIEGLRDSEQDEFDNMIDALQSPKGQKIASTIHELEQACEHIDKTVQCLMDAL